MKSPALQILCLTVLTAPLAAQEMVDPRGPDLRPTERLEALAEHVRRAHAGLETLEARFSQSRQSAMLFEPSEAHGVFSYAAPDRVRWEYETPDPISLLIADNEMTTWYRDLGRAEKTNVGGRSQRVLQYMGASTSLDTLLDYFSVTLQVPEAEAGPYFLHLKPLFERVEKRIKDLQIWIDGESFLPYRLRFVEGDGDVTEYRFTELRVNRGLPPERFVLGLPPEVRVRETRFDGSAAGR